jgi:hypothetical protein
VIARGLRWLRDFRRLRSMGLLRSGGSIATCGPAARRARLITVWALALLFGWPASLPWLEPGMASSIGSSGDARTITGAGAGWIRSAEAQNRRRRRRAARRNRRPAAPAQGDNRPAPGDSGPGPTAPAVPPAGKNEDKVFDFTGLDISGQLRTPQLLYFLDRAAEELDRASLERRSFIPEMVQSIDEESL